MEADVEAREVEIDGIASGRSHGRQVLNRSHRTSGDGIDAEGVREVGVHESSVGPGIDHHRNLWRFLAAHAQAQAQAQAHQKVRARDVASEAGVFGAK